jgi:hypothetical protein
VKAHADKKKTWHKLTRAEQVNVYCDTEATSALRQQIKQPSKRPKFHPLPGMTTYLKHGDKFVTGHEKRTLLWSSATEDLLSYYAKKYEWSRTIKKRIDWAAFESAEKGSKHLEHFLPKLCCSWLPTTFHLNKREGITDECLHCQQSETNEHLFTCPKNQAQRILFMIQFQGLLIDLKTDPKIQHAMVAGLKTVVNNANDENTDNQPTTRLPAAIEQSKIGWIHVFRGFLSQKWQDQQDTYERQQPTEKDTNKNNRWNVKVVQFLWKYAHKIWVERCKMVHDKDSEHESQHARKRAEQSVTAMYRHARNVSALDRSLIFHRDLTDRLTDSVTELSAWSQIMLPALKKAMKQHKKQEKQGQTQIYGTSKKWKPDSTNTTKIQRRNSIGPSTPSRETREDNNKPT